MESNLIDIKIKKFVRHLNKIGILTEADNPQFLNNFYELGTNNFNTSEMLSTNIEISEKYFQENLSNTLTLFLNSLTEEKKKVVALNIYKNYILETNSSLSEKGYKLYKLYKNFKISIFFKKWFVLTKSMSTFKTISKIRDKKDSLEDTNNNTYNNTISYNVSNIQNKYGKNIPNVNNSYNSSYNYSPSNGIKKNKSSDIIVNLKNNSNKINLTRNHQYDLNIGKLIDSSQKKNKDNSKSYTFTNDYSPYNNKKEKQTNYEYYKKDLISSKGNQLFNKKINLNKNSHNKLNLKLKAHFEYLGNLSKSKNHKLIPEKTTEYIKEQEELKNNCTFKPKINKYKTPKASTKKIYYDNNSILRTEKLYLDNQKRMARRDADILLRDNKLSKETTFKPNLISSSVKKIQKNFSLRLENFNKLKEEKMKKMMKSLENDYNSVYTFSPTVNSTYNNINHKTNNSNTNLNSNSKGNKVSAFQRLYNDNKEKLLRLEERKNQAMEEILYKANNPITNNKTNLNLSENNYMSKSVDYQKIEELYNDYKKKKIKIKQKQQTLDNEKGLTFNPLLVNGEKYLDKVEPNFFEREKKFVENQRNHIEAYKNFLIKEKEKYFKRYSEDKKIIIKNVVDRLYKEGLEKYMIRNNTKPNIHTKNYYLKNESKEYDGNETVYVNQSILNVDSIANTVKNKNSKNILFADLKTSNESNLIKSNVKTSMKTSDNLSTSKDNLNIVEQLPLIMDSK